MADNQKPLLTFQGNDHFLDLILGALSSAPIVEIPAKDIIDAEVRFTPSEPELDRSHPTYYKHDGKYIVLLGKKKVAEQLEKGQTVLKGRFLSKPALKQTRVPDPALLAAAAERAAQPAYESTGYTPNRPRFNDNRSFAPRTTTTGYRNRDSS